MSEFETADARSRRAPRLRDGNRIPTRTRRNDVDLSEMQAFLAQLDLPVSPGLHINGANYPQAAVVVDFGQPLRSQRLTPEQSADLVTRMRKLTREIMGREVNVRVSNENSTGIWWATVG